MLPFGGTYFNEMIDILAVTCQTKNIKMKSYLRFLGRNKLYTAIEVVGLSLALAFIIPLVNVLADKYERTHAHERWDDIYVVAYMGNMWTDVNFCDYLMEQMPEVEMAASAIINDRMAVGKDFFEFFPFEFIEGDESFLDLRNNIAVSDKFAAMIADGSAIGKSVMIEGNEYTVAAVFKSGRNDILKECSILENIAPYKELHLNGGQASGLTFIRLGDGHDRKEAQAKILEYADRYNEGSDNYFKMKEMGVARELIRYDELPSCLYNYGHFMFHQPTSMTLVSILLGLIFIVAILNYINLNVALSTTRAKENATRRLIGASRRTLIMKSLAESFVFTAACFILGYLMSGYTSSYIKSLFATTGFTDFSVDPIWNIRTLSASAGIIIITALIAGISPSVIASRFTPLDVTKGDFRLHGKRRLSRFFISFQTILSIILLSGVLMISKCYKNTMKVDFNCDIEDVAFLKCSPDQAEVMVSKASTDPEILSVGLASQVPAQGFTSLVKTPKNPQYFYSHIACDRAGFDVFGFEILELFEPDYRGLWLTPQTKSVIERDSLLLDQIYKATGTDRIAGTINDFPGTAPLEISEIVLTFASVKDNPSVKGVVFRTTEDHAHGKDKIISLFNEVLDNDIPDALAIQNPVKYVREMLHENMAPLKIVLDTIGLVMLLVVFMSMMGLAGMSIHFTNERRNEIAVRRIFGATENGVLMRTLRFYLIITAVASAIGICVAEAVRMFFSTLGTRTTDVWWVYVAAVVLSFAISISSVLLQIVRAARTNPAEALKKE